jgi:hypothetical protein
MIEISILPSGRFSVTIQDANGASHHQITMDDATRCRIFGETHAPEACIEAALRFLLDREPKESILSEFDVAVISRYFPEFEREIGSYLR